MCGWQLADDDEWFGQHGTLSSFTGWANFRDSPLKIDYHLFHASFHSLEEA